MKKHYKHLILLIFILTSLIVSYIYYPYLPEQMASHWNAQGEVDGYTNKLWGSLVGPIVLLFLLILYWLVPKIDPLKENIKKFKSYFYIFIIVLSLFLLVIHILVIFWNSGIYVAVDKIATAGIGIMMIISGMLIKNAKQNYSIGIRTPWTLANKLVWQNTHQLFGPIFSLIGVSIIIGLLLFNDYLFLFSLVLIIGVVIASYIYSYLRYVKINSIN